MAFSLHCIVLIMLLLFGMETVITLQHIPPPIAHMKEEYKKRFQELETYLEDEKFVKKFDYKEFSGMLNSAAKLSRVDSVNVHHVV